MEELIGFIGISESLGTADSGLYVDALPDISILSMNKIADEDQRDCEGVMKDVENRALRKFRTLFTIELNRCFHINKREYVECLIIENKLLLAEALWYLMGAELMFERTASSRINKFTTIDKAKAQRLMYDFNEQFRIELATAISGIDINRSDCFNDEQPEHTPPLVGFIEILP